MIKRTQHFLTDIYYKRDILLDLAKRDFKQQYVGSMLGATWVFVQPLLYVFVIYLVFTFGLRAGKVSGNMPFSSYLISGYIAWTYLSSNMTSGSRVIKEFSFLLKKVDFRLSMLPLVKLISSALPHLVLLGITILVNILNGIYPTFYLVQLLYYFIAMLALLMGTSWLTSSTNIFLPDVAQIVTVMMTFGFWLTPIFWDISMVPEQYQWILHLNPAEYIITGYRDSMLYHIGFWEKPIQTLYFWTFTALMMWGGISTFKKLRPHFAEVV